MESKKYIAEAMKLTDNFIFKAESQKEARNIATIEGYKKNVRFYRVVLLNGRRKAV